MSEFLNILGVALLFVVFALMGRRSRSVHRCGSCPEPGDGGCGACPNERE